MNGYPRTHARSLLDLMRLELWIFSGLVRERLRGERERERVVA